MASTINVKIAPLPRGDYSSSATYAKLDVVSYNGSSYMAIKAVPTGTVPTNTTYWQLLAEMPTIGDGSITTDKLADGAITTAKLADGAVTDAKLAQTGGVLEEVADLKNAIDDITETVYSKNIFDKASYTITTGKYLNYTNGNVGTNADYCYVNDYIPVESSTQYYMTVWNQNGNLAGAFNGFTLFYDENKAFISGLSGNNNPITTPATAKYIRISTSTNSYNTYNYMLEKGSVNSPSYIPYSVISKLKLPITIVDINGNGDFTSIASAVNTLSDGSAILVMPGTYEENVKAWTKEIHIIGIDREACVLKDTSGNYSTPPLEIGAGSIQNMSIIEVANGAGTESWGAYAIHIEDNNLFNKKLLIRNCYVYSDSSSAIGMGLRGGCTVRIEGCEIICAGARASTSAAPLYFHDADGQAYWGTANLYLHGNVLRNTASSLFSMLTINSIHAENTTYMHMMYNIFVRSKTPAISQKYNTWNTGGVTGDGWNGLNKMYLEDDSFGNNQTELNYSE